MAAARWYAPRKTVLLTGAGFTKGFGGYLAREMWAEILNQPQIQSCDRLRKKLLDNLDFESIYDEVQDSLEFDQDEKNMLTDAVLQAYAGMDSALSRVRPDTAAGAYGVCRDFIGRFGGMSEPGRRGFIFTLNQDLFLERFYRSAEELLQVPGLGHPDWFARLPADLEATHKVLLPGAEKVHKWEKVFWDKAGGIGSFVYVKLHGSFYWWSQEVSQVLAVGIDKEGKIREPLLLWYRELFREVLNESGMTLVVIGYSFRDKYINNIIADAINGGLRIVVVCPDLPDNFKARLQSVQGTDAELCHRGEEIWRGICGYWCGQVTDFCNPTQTVLTPRGRAFFDTLRF